MSDRMFLAVSLAGWALAALALIGAAALDAPGLALAGCAAIGGVLVARTVWQGRSRARQLAVVAALVGAVVAVAFAVSALSA